MKRSILFRLLIFFAASIVIATVAQAQTLYNQNAKITVAPNTSLLIKGEVDNQGTIVNDGHLKVSGPWLNSGTYIPGEGQVTFNSTSATIPQIIHHNGQTFNRLTVSGGTRKIILSDIVIGREIRFDHGVIEAAGDSRVVFDADVTIFSPSDSSHVHGVVYQHGSGHKLFPLGNGSMYLPVEFSDIRDAAAKVGVRAFEFDNLSLAIGPTLKSISDKRYWHIDVESGSLPDSPVILPLRGESWSADPGNVVVVESGSPNENFTSIGGLLSAKAGSNERIKSEFNISKPFISLAIAAPESGLVVYNAVSSNDDGLNDYLRIENIENYPGNRLTVFNRWGDKVFEIENYDNDRNVFTGRSNLSGQSELVSGSYFYVLELPGRESLRGFIAVKN